jgi:hypothetical protein
LVFRGEFLVAVELGLHFGCEVVAQVLSEDLLEGVSLAFGREGIANLIAAKEPFGNLELMAVDGEVRH